MYLFDLYDYYFDRFIGNKYEEIPICDVGWENAYNNASSTSDQYIKSLIDWYESSTTCLEDGECKDAILAKWAVVQSDITSFNLSLTAFWQMMSGETCTGVYDPVLYQDYITSQQTLLCDVEELTYLVDGLVQ